MERCLKRIEHAHVAYSTLPEYRTDFEWGSIFHLWPLAEDAALASYLCAAAVAGLVHKGSYETSTPVSAVCSDEASAESSSNVSSATSWSMEVGSSHGEYAAGNCTCTRCLLLAARI